MTLFGYVWKLIREDTGQTVHSGIAADKRGMAEQIRNAIAESPIEVLVPSPGIRGVILRIEQWPI